MGRRIQRPAGARCARLAALSALALACSSGGEPRHVVLVSLDAVGAKHVGAYGYERDTTPRLDAVAREGVVFESAYAPQTWTLTSHLSMMTGVAPRVHGATSTRAASPGVTTLAEVLGSFGFRTAAFAGGVAWMRPGYGMGRGFDRYELGAADAGRDTPHIVRWLGEQARRLEADPQHRFFLFVHYFDAHSDAGTRVPYAVPEPFDPYTLGFLREGQRWSREGGTDLLIRLAHEGHSAEDREFASAWYDASVRYVDEVGLGALVAALDDLGLTDDTLLVVTADHGEELFEHGSVLHGFPYDETARVPLVMRGPGLPRGRRVSGLVSLVDLAPTILGQLSLPVPPSVHGRDLAPLLAGNASVREALVVDGGRRGDRDFPSHLIADLDGRRWSYLATVREEIHGGEPRFTAQRPGELFALDRDPAQQIDLAAREPELALRLETMLLEHLRADAALARRFPPGRPSGVLTRQDREALEALGYAE
ncbi:MAG: sulfatase [Myxococcota bacterium]|nr:sulfatase [Myxococcota bacterium]